MKERISISKFWIFFFTVFSVWIFLAPCLAERLVVKRPLDRADVILVLAGSAAYVERTREAALLYGKGVAPKVLLTDDGKHGGWSKKEQTNLPYVELARRELVAQGVPVDSIEILLPKSSGTIMEAEILAKQAAEKRWQSLLIVTSAYHTRRALWTFENVFSKNGIKTQIGIMPVISARQTQSAFLWWLTWTGWRDVAGEYVKIAYYNLAY